MELDKRILDTLEKRNLAPRPYYMFMAKRSVFWTLAAVSIMFGAISSAVLLFVVSDYYATDWRMLDNLPLDGLILSIPVLWLLSMPLLLASAYFGLRHTRRGYRFHWGKVVVICLAASIGLGEVLHLFNAGQRINDFLVEHVDWYKQQADVPFDIWSRPEQGYLGGRADLFFSESKLRLVDFNLNIWTVDIAGARIDLDQSILAEGDVAIRGEVVGPMQFRADTIGSFD